ncbi:MAG: bifunctional hydroxymethylpyrimidine kinase/phosphomethylpyrimidine kinase [Candidatus Bathyarchaeia archaeon]
MVGSIPRALTIAGSDSGGGAGIQADLKTFAALGVHGMSAITAVTAQNTVGVAAIQDIDPEVVRAQIRAVVEDIGIDAAKTGMLHTREVIALVAQELSRANVPIVVDPVMVAKSGARLLRPDAVDALVRDLLPISTVVTPNAMEAGAISGIEVRDLEGAKRAAEAIARLGPKVVVVKGGHLGGDRAIDVVYDGDFHLLDGEMIASKATHGTGCSFASAIAAGLAKGKEPLDAIKEAKEFVAYAIRFGLELGKGHGPVNPMAMLFNEAERYWVIRRLREAIGLLERSPIASKLVPEVQMNLAFALPNAAGRGDVAAIPGRIVKVDGGVKASCPPEFGASGHVANTVLAAMKFDRGVRSALNIRYSEKIIEACRELGYVVSHYDRALEPPEVKMREGGTTAWGAEYAIRSLGRVPDVIYHKGDWGKEPMVTLLGRDPLEVVEKALRLARSL